MDTADLTMFLLAVSSVGLWTLRVAVAARGLKVLGAAVAALEAVVFVLTFSKLFDDLGSPSRIVAYALGVGVGTVLGLAVNERLTSGRTELRIIAEGDRPDLVVGLRERCWPVTASTATGLHGPATEIWLVVDDSEVGAALRDVESFAPDAFWTLQSLRQVSPTPLPPGYHQVAVGGRRSLQRRGRARELLARPTLKETGAGLTCS